MKKDIHPKYETCKVTFLWWQYICSITTGDMRVSICNARHPFYTIKRAMQLKPDALRNFVRSMPALTTDRRTSKPQQNSAFIRRGELASPLFLMAALQPYNALEAGSLAGHQLTYRQYAGGVKRSCRGSENLLQRFRCR